MCSCVFFLSPLFGRRPLQDLRERYACVELKASLPLVPFRETIVAPGQVNCVMRDVCCVMCAVSCVLCLVCCVMYTDCMLKASPPLFPFRETIVAPGAVKLCAVLCAVCCVRCAVLLGCVYCDGLHGAPRESFFSVNRKKRSKSTVHILFTFGGHKQKDPEPLQVSITLSPEKHELQS